MTTATGISTEFKMTEIGLLPNDWKVAKLGSIVNPILCMTF